VDDSLGPVLVKKGWVGGGAKAEGSAGAQRASDVLLTDTAPFGSALLFVTAQHSYVHS